MDNKDCLEKLGFSQNEAKIYTTLLKCGMLNGYEIAKQSGVSRAMVYEVINRMVGKGILLKLEGEPSYYKPLEYEELIGRIRKENESNIGRAEEFLKSLAGTKENQDYVLNIVGFDKFVKKAVELIDAATRELSLSVWSGDFELLRDALDRAVKRGIKVYLFTFEEIDFEGAVIFSYRISDASGLFPYRRISLVVDGGQCLAGENSGDGSIFIYTKNHAVVSLATDEIVLNIFWYKYMEKQGLLREKNTGKVFLQTIGELAEELNINEDMTKNFMVFDFQRGKDDEDKNGGY